MRGCWALAFISLYNSTCLLQSSIAQSSITPNNREIVTDRPAITESSVVVPSGTLQSENGVTGTRDHGKRTFDFPEAFSGLAWGAIPSFGSNCRITWLLWAAAIIHQACPIFRQG